VAGGGAAEGSGAPTEKYIYIGLSDFLRWEQFEIAKKGWTGGRKIGTTSPSHRGRGRKVGRVGRVRKV
jgi:hypothetical protein